MKFIKNTTGITFIRILKLTSFCVCFIIGIFCNSTRPQIPVITKGGTPPPNWQVKVSGRLYVTDSSHLAHSRFRIVLDDKSGLSSFHYSDTPGYYSTGSAGIIHPPSIWILHVEDADSNTNGFYKNKDTTFTIPIDSTFDTSTYSRRWIYKGDKTIDLYLDPK
jgi:hypothetical protein